MGVPGGERGNVQTGRGDRVSTINQPGCSTSVALATGPTEEEEERECDQKFGCVGGVFMMKLAVQLPS